MFAKRSAVASRLWDMGHHGVYGVTLRHVVIASRLHAVPLPTDLLLRQWLFEHQVDFVADVKVFGVACHVGEKLGQEGFDDR